jgi:hypothetical protein
MEAVTTRPMSPARAEALLASLLAATVALALITLAPPGGDAAAHLYRTLLVREGVHVWDNLWFAGQYPLASYSLLYYLPAALVGNVPLVLGAVVLSAALFAAIAFDEWGETARWPIRAFALLAAGPLFTGTYSYALGLAAALAALRLLQLNRTWPALACAGLTLGFSPLAFVFLCLVLLAAAIARRRLGRQAFAVAAGLGAAAGIELATIALFPSHGRYPFATLSLVGVLSVSALGAALALRTRGGELIAPFFVLWALVNLAAFFVSTPFGDNLTRIRAFVFPLVLLTASLARFRPRWLAGAALSVALVYNLGPYVIVFPERADSRASQESFWRPALQFLRDNSTPDYRVEVVPTFDHWEAYWVPRAGFPLARGWYRQLDLASNPELYRTPLDGKTYRGWLSRMGVRYVLLPGTELGPMGAGREATLLRSGRSGLLPVFRSRDWTIYEFTRARPLLTGPGGGTLDRLGHERIAGRTGAAGAHLLRVRYTRYWQVVRGDVCLRPSRNGMTTLVARKPGRFVLALPEKPTVLVRAALGANAAACG